MTAPATPARRGSRLRSATAAPSDPVITPTPAPANPPTTGNPMAANCPHCTKPIESLPGFVPQATLEQRINEKNAKIEELTPKAQGYDTVNAELLRARQEAAIAREDLALAGRGLTDPKKIAALRAIYTAETAGIAEAQRPAFAAYLDGDGKEHPVVAMVLATTAAPGAPAPAAASAAPAPAAAPAAPNPNAPQAPAAPAPAAPAAAPAPNQLPAVNANAVTPPATPQTQLTAQQLAEYFRSPAYLALPKEKRAEKRAELEAQYKGQSAGPIAA